MRPIMPNRSGSFTKISLRNFVSSYQPLIKPDWNIEVGEFPFQVHQETFDLEGCQTHWWAVNRFEESFTISTYSGLSGRKKGELPIKNGCVVFREHETELRNPATLVGFILGETSHKGKRIRLTIPLIPPFKFKLKASHKLWGSTWQWSISRFLLTADDSFSHPSHQTF